MIRHIIRVTMPEDEDPSNAIQPGYEYEIVEKTTDFEVNQKLTWYRDICIKRGEYRHAKVDFWNGYKWIIHKVFKSD